LGHSYGEYVAACLAGVLSLEDGLRLAVARGRLMSQLPPGAMLAVGLSEAELRPLLPAGVSLAALNAPDRCVISGPTPEVERLAEVLKQREVGMMRLPAPHAFHSAAVEPLMPELARVVASLKRSAPTLRYVSSLTGTWASAEQVAAPGYWADQMRQPVRFASGVQTLLREGCSVLLEVGPGQDLTGLVRACLGEDRHKVKALPSLRRAAGSTSEHSVLLRSVGEVWAQGLEVDWTAFHAGERRLRLSLPTYPFEEAHCWVEGTPATREAPALPTPVPTAATATAAPLGLPLGEIEERVAALWRERLGVEHVGRDDDFLELGGNSLMAAQLLSRLRDTFGVQVPLGDLFEAPTVARLAQRIEALLQSTQQEQTRQLSLAPQPRTGELALSSVQERVWRAEQYLPGLSAYNMPFVLRLEGPLRAELFERSIQELVHRHEILRTTYEEVDGRPVQRFHASMHVPLEVRVLSGTREEREAEALRLAREDAARPFDLVKGPVMRTTLVRLHEDVHVLLCNIHHIASDTLSCVFFIQELGQTYDALRRGLPSPLAPLPLQYADFGDWQKRALAEGFLTEQQQWWRRQLAGLPRQLDLPTDRPRPSSCAFTSRRVPVDFPRALATELAAFSTREGVTSFMTLLAAWQTLLHRYSGQSDIVVATPIANRSRPELQPLMGYVAQSVALRTDLGGDPTFRELLGRVREGVSGAYAHPDVPFEQLLEELFPERKTGQWRLSDSVCILHGGTGEQASSELGGMRATLVEVPDTPVQWGATLADLALVLTQEHGRVHGALEYAAELFDEARVLRMMEHLWVLLGAAMARPEERLSRLPLLTEAERREWEAPRPAATAVPTVPERLAARAARHPEAVATVQGEREWTRAELVARAEHLAARLRALGVRPGVAVGVCLKPSPEKLVALWGVLRAGGATVALGPTDLSGLAAYAPPGGAVPLLLTWRGLTTSARLEPSRILYMEELEHPGTAPAASVRPDPEDLACILPTTGARPAWTLTHRGLERLFESMDERLRPAEGGAWVAATESTAERPELELLWALSRGLRVVFPPERLAANLVHLRADGPRSRPVELSLSYFADDEDSLRGPKYELLLEGAKFADAHGFSAVWTPERHFNSFGGLYPQPGVISAALATHTRNLQLRAGSVVLPLHDPLLVAEQWSVVDNLSQGRVGISVASGWHTHDFAYAPDNYKERRAILMRNLQTVRELWRGKRLERRGGDGETVEVGLRPRPVQRELPIWLTAASNPETFRLAGELGAGVLTNLMAHDLAELGPKVALYREAWRRHGHPGRGHITLMLHTFIGTDEQQVLKTVREPLLRYLRSSLEVVDTLLASQGLLNRKDELTEQDITAILEHGFERYVYQAGLIGSRESGLRRLKALREVDVDEVACLIDFGLETSTVLEGLRHLAGLREHLEQEAGEQREQVLAEGERGAEELLELARREGTVLQATAWLARRVTELPRAEEALWP
ncbi:MAG: MupA/Atu3671 family FMN-dependent luciferase-like monooxygenase, partial [Archangium sp.]